MANIGDIWSMVSAGSSEMWPDVLNKGIAGALTGLAAGGIYGWASGSGFWDGAVKAAMWGGLGSAGWQFDKSLATGFRTAINTSGGRRAIESMAEDMLPKTKSGEIDVAAFVDKVLGKGGALGGMADEGKAKIREALSDPQGEGYQAMVEKLTAAQKQMTVDRIVESIGKRHGTGLFISAMSSDVQATPEGLAKRFTQQYMAGALSPTTSHMSGIWDSLTVDQKDAARQAWEEKAKQAAQGANQPEPRGGSQPQPNYGNHPLPPPLI